MHGLLSKVVSEDKLEQEVNAIANKIVSLSQPVVALGKTCFYSQTVKGRDQAYTWVPVSKRRFTATINPRSLRKWPSLGRF